MVVHFNTIKNLFTNFFGYVHMCTKFLGHVQTAHAHMIGEHKKPEFSGENNKFNKFSGMTSSD